MILGLKPLKPTDIRVILVDFLNHFLVRIADLRAGNGETLITKTFLSSSLRLIPPALVLLLAGLLLVRGHLALLIFLLLFLFL
jgi:hypothetical protein